MLVRRATPGDFPVIIELWKEFMDFHMRDGGFYQRAPDGHLRWKDHMLGKLDADDYLILVACLENEPVGYCIASIMDYPPVFTTRNYGYIWDMAVTAKARRRGIAKALFEGARQWIEDKGVTRVELKVDAYNETSRAFWKAMGFGAHTETWAREVVED